MKLLISAGFLVLFGAASCSGGKTEYKYSFSAGTDCTTGNQVFTTLSAMCTALQSDADNNGCSLAARQAFFADNCPGTFAETP
ncbi:MAG TPA: hypothetical protein VGP07_18325 [Polyangia bacterium]|jgi:hypothetical protein